MTEQPRPNQNAPHLYVPQGQFPAPANINEPSLSHIDVARVSPPKPAPRKAVPLSVFCDLPERLPVLPQEVALIRAYLPHLLAKIAANDNEA